MIFTSNYPTSETLANFGFSTFSHLDNRIATMDDIISIDLWLYEHLIVFYKKCVNAGDIDQYLK